MKANAKKLLALIMAMVMCLSLAAPAMAAGADALPLAVQATATPTNTTPTDVITIEGATDGSGKYTVYQNGAAIAAGNVTSSSQPSGITVVKGEGGHIGQSITTAYTVTHNASGAKATVAVGTGSGTMSFLDVKDWKNLNDGQTALIGGKYYEVKGTVYQESAGSGLYTPYFQLYKLNAAKNGFDTSVSPLYFKGVAGAELKSADDFTAALGKATECNVYGQPTTGNNAYDAGAALATVTVDEGTVAYTFTTINPSEDLTVSGGATVTANFTGTEKTAGTFQVSVLATTTKTTGQTTAYVTDAAQVQKLLADKWNANNNAKLEGVEAASGNYLTVKVSKNVTADPFATASDLYCKNIAHIGDKAVLIDLSKDGWYKGTTDKGANANAVPANTEALGPVIVRRSELGSKITPTGFNIADSDRTFVVYESVEKMQKGIVANDCTGAKTINYVQVVLNPWNGDKQNKLVNEPITKTTDAVKQSDAQAFTLVSNYTSEAFNTPNADFVKKGTYDVPATAHGTKIKTEKITKAATCQEKGEKTVTTTCTICKTALETTTEEIPVVADPLEKYKPADYTKWAFPDKSFKTGHYVAKQEDTTTVDPDTGMVTVTTTYTCNFNHVHSEETHVETYKKSDLQHSGTWTAFSVDKYTALEQRNLAKGTLGLVKSVTLADTDVELATVPLNRVGKDQFFTWNVRTLGNGNADGTYTDFQSLTKPIDVYATAAGLPTSKYYAAKLTIKDIVVPENDCEDASCTVTVDVYELTKKAATATATYTDLIQDDVLEKNLKDKKVTLVKSHTENVVIAGDGHKYFNNLGEATDLCVVCGKKKEKSETPDENDLATATVTIDPVMYAGTALTEKDLNITVKIGKTILARGIDYQVGELNIKAAGKYTVVIAGMNTYNGRQAVELTVTAQSTTAKKQTLKASITKKTFKVKNLKKKKASFTTKLSGAKTAVTWKSSNAKVTVKGSKTKATITVKKGTKKGTYKVTATAKKTSAYKKGTVTVKVIVK